MHNNLDHEIASLRKDETLVVTYTKRNAGLISPTANGESSSFLLILAFLGMLIIVFFKTTDGSTEQAQPSQDVHQQNGVREVKPAKIKTPYDYE